MPAAMETISCSGFSAGAKAWHTAFMACGLTDRTTTSASATASALDSTTSMANSPAIFARCSAPGSLARICAAGTPWARRPPIRLAAMLPAPMNAMRGVLIGIPSEAGAP